MKVKTFWAGFANGGGAAYSNALQSLDEQLRKELGENIKIYSLQDTLYRKEKPDDPDSRLARVVIYDTLDRKLKK